jgi:hypothetical protein
MKEAFLIQVRENGRHRVWNIHLDGATLRTEWGQLGGEMQTTEDTLPALNVGKKNEKPPEQVASEEFDRKILDKHRQGFAYWDLKNIPENSTYLDPFSPLPEALRFWKPTNDMSATMLKLTRADPDRMIYFRKREGEAFFIQALAGKKYVMYSRTLQRTWKDEPDIPWFDRFPTILQSVELAEPSPGTILAGELVFGPETDNFSFVETIMRSSTPNAITAQQLAGWPLCFYMWHVPFLGGSNNRDQNALWQVQVMEDFARRDETERLLAPTVKQYSDPELALDDAVRFGWEGWVVHDLQAPIGDAMYTTYGQVPRPTYVAKLKPEGEDDFAVYWNPEQGIGTYGTGKNRQRIGSVALYQYDGSGNLIFISNCAGITNEQREVLSNPALYPRVWKVKFQKRFYLRSGDKSNAVIQPRFDVERTDKTPSECFNANL